MQTWDSILLICRVFLYFSEEWCYLYHIYVIIMRNVVANAPNAKLIKFTRRWLTLSQLSGLTYVCMATRLVKLKKPFYILLRSKSQQQRVDTYIRIPKVVREVNGEFKPVPFPWGQPEPGCLRLKFGVEWTERVTYKHTHTLTATDKKTSEADREAYEPRQKSLDNQATLTAASLPPPFDNLTSFPLWDMAPQTLESPPIFPLFFFF